MIINSHQLSYYYNILLINELKIKTTKTQLQLRKHSILESFLTTNVKFYVKGNVDI